MRQALKKRIETVAAGNVVHSEAAKPPLRGRHGAGAQGIPAAVRPAASGGVHGRDEQAARGGSPREVAGTPRVAGEVRRPLPPPGRMHGVDVRRATIRLWRMMAVTKRRTTLDWAKQVRALANLPRYRDAEAITLVCDNLNTHSGDSFYASVPGGGRSQSAERPHPLGAHAETRELAERCGTGVQCVAPPVPGSPDREQGFGHVGNGGLGRGAQSRTDRGRLAAQRRRRAHQTEASIPEN